MQKNISYILNRNENLFLNDLEENQIVLNQIIKSSSFLIIGGAGSIGSSVVNEIFKRNPKILHVVDNSENNLTELVRYLRSSVGYIDGEFETFAIDSYSDEFDTLIENKPSYDFVFNLAALKHVRSESDPYTLMRMTLINVHNTYNSLKLTKLKGSKKYFSVSSDKSTNPVNLMGASKSIMEKILIQESKNHYITSARFANVAFSDGSLLHGFDKRLINLQPITAPIGIKRYFITQKESGELCLLSGLIGENREIFFPKLDPNKHMQSFDNIAIKYLEDKGYTPYLCQSEEEARKKSKDLISNKKWPCYFFQSKTTGEKEFEEFYDHQEIVNLKKFNSIGVIKLNLENLNKNYENFMKEIDQLRISKKWTKKDILNIYQEYLPNFKHLEKKITLNQIM